MKVYLDGMKKAKAAQEKRAAANAAFTKELRSRYNAEGYRKEYFEGVMLPKMQKEIDEHNRKVDEDFKAEMQETAAEMLEAARTLKAAQDFRTQALDFDDQRLVNALKMLDLYGKAMPIEEQRNLCLTFAGDMPALQAIEHKMKQNGMKYYTIAQQLQAKISQEVTDEMEMQAYKLTKGKYDLKSYEKWFTDELTGKADIYGLDLQKDPYREAIKNDAYMTGSNSPAFQEQERQSKAHKLIAQWEKDLQEMEAAGNTEQANRAAKQIYDVLAEDGIKFRE